MTSEFKVIDPKAYWAERAADAAVFIKDVTVTARLATAGEEIVTQMKDGHVETTNTANDGDVIIRNPSGEEYIIGGAKFAQRYAGAERLSATYGDFKAAGQPTPCVRLTEDVEFTAPWGTPMQIKKGGVLVIGGANDI